ncbi:hypothetical protein T310_4366 [Rasamsonia emersonii CBS 393.64]|uniref:Uncharacterized protein n=1 Tax=Rasamsonia emersonii (strain ATCC 16479 / CBS 393.64 / IMI 116815) TaxID=1408163 RepID=A0A0F4YTK3_RASE3|nr:hypothetical protein T310_4366 [Rasamsonia emersonii CBS 393.64]KKA21579.1 hypothetical protein T310_4366 [Rasamsonia emersonii CBS 393.64]
MVRDVICGNSKSSAGRKVSQLYNKLAQQAETNETTRTLYSLQLESEIRVRLTQVLQLFQVFPAVIPGPRALHPVPSPVLRLQGEIVDRHGDARHDAKRQAHAKPDRVPWTLARDEHVARHQGTTVAEPGQQAHRHRPLDALSHVDAQPHHDRRHVDEGAGRDEEHAHVQHAGVGYLRQLDRPPDHDQDGPQHGEGIPMAQMVAQPGADQRQHKRRRVDGNRMPLRRRRRPSQVAQDGRLEGYQRAGRFFGGHIQKKRERLPDPDLPVRNHRQNSTQGDSVVTHAAAILFKTGQQQGLLLRSQELRVLRKWDDDEEANRADDQGDDGFHYEDPTQLA